MKIGIRPMNHTNELTRRTQMDNSEEREALEDWFFEKLRTTFTPGEIKMLIEEYKQKKKELGKEKKEETDEG
jgi:hypothetical protein